MSIVMVNTLAEAIDAYLERATDCRERLYEGVAQIIEVCQQHVNEIVRESLLIEKKIKRAKKKLPEGNLFYLELSQTENLQQKYGDDLMPELYINVPYLKHALRQAVGLTHGLLAFFERGTTLVDLNKLMRRENLPRLYVEVSDDQSMPLSTEKDGEIVISSPDGWFQVSCNFVSEQITKSFGNWDSSHRFAQCIFGDGKKKHEGLLHNNKLVGFYTEWIQNYITFEGTLSFAELEERAKYVPYKDFKYIKRADLAEELR